MKYDASSIQILDDPVAIIRRWPKMYVGSEDIRPGWLAAALARDALDLGCKHAEIHRMGDWWIVASEEDWLTYHNRMSVRETFNRILPTPVGVNGCRSEVVVRALAASVFTSIAGELVVLSGDETVARELLAREPLCRLGGKRVVAFAMAPSNAPIEQPNE